VRAKENQKKRMTDNTNITRQAFMRKWLDAREIQFDGRNLGSVFTEKSGIPLWNSQDPGVAFKWYANGFKPALQEMTKDRLEEILPILRKAMYARVDMPPVLSVLPEKWTVDLKKGDPTLIIKGQRDGVEITASEFYLENPIFKKLLAVANGVDNIPKVTAALRVLSAIYKQVVLGQAPLAVAAPETVPSAATVPEDNDAALEKEIRRLWAAYSAANTAQDKVLSTSLPGKEKETDRAEKQRIFRQYFEAKVRLKAKEGERKTATPYARKLSAFSKNLLSLYDSLAPDVQQARYGTFDALYEAGKKAISPEQDQTANETNIIALKRVDSTGQNIEGYNNDLEKARQFLPGLEWPEDDDEAPPLPEDEESSSDDENFESADEGVGDELSEADRKYQADVAAINERIKEYEQNAKNFVLDLEQMRLEKRRMLERLYRLDPDDVAAMDLEEEVENLVNGMRTSKKARYEWLADVAYEKAELFKLEDTRSDVPAVERRFDFSSKLVKDYQAQIDAYREGLPNDVPGSPAAVLIRAFVELFNEGLSFIEAEDSPAPFPDLSEGTNLNAKSYNRASKIYSIAIDFASIEGALFKSQRMPLSRLFETKRRLSDLKIEIAKLRQKDVPVSIEFASAWLALLVQDLKGVSASFDPGDDLLKELGVSAFSLVSFLITSARRYKNATIDVLKEKFPFPAEKAGQDKAYGKLLRAFNDAKLAYLESVAPTTRGSGGPPITRTGVTTGAVPKGGTDPRPSTTPAILPVSPRVAIPTQPPPDTTTTPSRRFDFFTLIKPSTRKFTEPPKPKEAPATQTFDPNNFWYYGPVGTNGFSKDDDEKHFRYSRGLEKVQATNPWIPQAREDLR
jgi:hypothetical protein